MTEHVSGHNLEKSRASSKMLVVLLTAELLALSSAQSRDQGTKYYRVESGDIRGKEERNEERNDRHG